MTDTKITDEEVIKALECCAEKGCTNCPLKSELRCHRKLMKNVHALFNRQKAEIEEKSKNITFAAKELIRLDRERSEVIKEFANNVVQELWKLNWHYGQLPCSEEDKTIQRAIKKCIAVVERNTKVMTEGNYESQST
jgi:hypothetical protein